MTAYSSFDRIYTVYEIKKTKIKSCKDFKGDNRGRTYIEVSKNFYDNAPFIKGAYPKRIYKKDFDKVKKKYNLENLSKLSGGTINRCQDYLEWSWTMGKGQYSNRVKLELINNDNNL